MKIAAETDFFAAYNSWQYILAASKTSQYPARKNLLSMQQGLRKIPKQKILENVATADDTRLVEIQKVPKKIAPKILA